jgi:hypothetical protein
MRIAIAIAFSLWLSGILGCASSMAQNANDIMNILGGLTRSAVAQATQAEWKKLPPNEVACIDQALRQRGASVGAAIQQGIMPSDSRVSAIRSNCQAQARAQPTTSTKPTAPKSAYSIDGLALGGLVPSNSGAYREYKCAPSEQFDGFVWCQKRRVEREARGQYASFYSILHRADGSAFYINRYLEPAFFSGNEAAEEVDRLSKKYGAPSPILKIPASSNIPYGIMASWGNITLEPLDANSVSELAAGREVREGFMVDHIGNYQRSAQLGLPIYRLRGGAGYLPQGPSG